jgi:hypothetical protein
MRRSISHYLILPVLFALASTACGDDITTIPIDPTPVTPTTDIFPGTINPNGGATHTFATARAGAVTVTLNSLSPDDTVTVGLSLGTWNGESCQTVIARDSTVAGNSIVGSASAAGNLCVRVYDVGKLAAATSYVVQAVHP